MSILAIDPGIAKCGIAVVAQGTPPKTHHREIVPTEQVISRITALISLHTISTILIGNATGSKGLVRTLRQSLPPEVPLHTVPEAYTSERARARYHQENPPTGWSRLLPAGLRTPPEPYDDYAAVILAEDWLALHARTTEG